MDNEFEDSKPTSSKVCIKEPDPSEFLKLQPKKSILKPKQASFENQEQREREQSELSEDSQKGAHFDEMNILATHHPPGKDYGHMKIDEPKTPYNAYSDSEDDSLSTTTRHRRVSLVGPVDADELNKGISKATSSIPKCFEPGSGPDSADESELTSEQITRKREFEKKRRAHYNEGLMLRKMRETTVNSTKDEQ